MSNVTRCYMTKRYGDTVVFESTDHMAVFHVAYENVQFKKMQIGWHASVWRNDMGKLKARMD